MTVLELTIEEIQEHRGIQERQAFNFVKINNLERVKRDEGTFYLVPEEILEKPKRFTQAQLHEMVLQLQADKMLLQEEKEKLHVDLLKVQLENAELQSAKTALSNQIATGNDVIKQAKQDQAEIEKLTQKLHEAQEELRQLPPWLIHLLRMLRGDKL